MGSTSDDPAGHGQQDRRGDVNLQAIAALAGVHISTASRVLRQAEPTKGWSASAQRVIAAAAELGYRPNRLAASLRTRRSNTIGVVMPRLADTVIATICQSVESAARSAGYQLLLTTPPDDMGAQLDAVDFLLSRQVDGLIVSSLHLSSPNPRLMDLPVPVIATNRHPGDWMPAVVGDDVEGGRMATEHLLALGHRRIGVIAGPRHASTAVERVAGFRLAHEQRDLAVDDALVVHSDFEVEGGVVGAHTLLSLSDPPTAIFAVNDTAAIGVMGAARQRGLRVPDDLSIVGYNDISVVAQLPTPMTTVHSPTALMGTVAVERLLAAIGDGALQGATLPVSLVVRSSTGRPAG
ncbi:MULTISPECIES: LacI family DNA-binding transcriptional regulator [Curtobacterium]|uniref:LacI family DNA-binding transcriptional regulator n=1 Tax=Curtobacterium TaxID=2034 RepID=UPI000A077CB0|nr:MULTISPECIES: LacI family DNA-binding transcriptional regulator [Curtobacterium]MCS0647381.1 LacI family transcriptional regulator [Curtobacterium flaccumfaciens pv. flaccumfaciens]MCS6524976.1 LacI family transcriptional regulator [Curtobacterium flaccumfaciens pv. flaccumfaciens]MCS6530122.1 LacI family transcriptional regulator [Curtobacterium flaccumfaciens pv. flaccumfaciens]MCS6556637.1 LacI family transcriptional regulator [Curtobacterium flaccumfaciens]QYI96540.1 LacI family transcr